MDTRARIFASPNPDGFIHSLRIPLVARFGTVICIRTPGAGRAEVHMKAGKLTLKYVPVDSLRENPDNAREHGSEIEELVNSVDRFGFADVIKVDKSMTIIAGHGRLIAAKRNGLTEVPVIVLPFNKEESKAFALIDNKTSDDSTWIMDRYDRQVKELKDLGWDMGSFGFELPDFGEFLPNVDDDMPEVPDTPRDSTGPASAGSFGVIAYCTDEDQRSDLLAYLMEAGIACKTLN